MRSTVRVLWKDYKLLFGGFLLAVGVMLFFAVRSIMFAVYWADPAHREEPIAGWMTPRYVAHSWAVPPTVIREALAIPPETYRLTVKDLAEERGVPTEEIVRKIETAIAAFRTNDAKAKP
jgi:hypothetical protein